MDALVGDEVKPKTGASELQSDALGPNSAQIRGRPIKKCVVGPQGFEPWTFGLKVRDASFRLVSPTDESCYRLLVSARSIDAYYRRLTMHDAQFGHNLATFRARQLDHR